MNEHMFLASTGNLKNDVTQFGLRVMLASAVALLVLVSIAVFQKNPKKLRRLLFLLMMSVITASSVSLIGSTIYLISKSESRGAVNWRADFEIWACGRQLELRDPNSLLSRKVGSDQLFERDDQRIYVDGIITDTQKEASLVGFLNSVGGSISNGLVSIPLSDNLFENHIDGDTVGTNNIDRFIFADVDGDKSLVAMTGDKCGVNPAEVQVFVYSPNGDDTYSQIKLTDPSSYTLSEKTAVPPGDCIIIDFDVKKESTDKLCQSYGLRDRERCLEFGSTERSDKRCDLRQTTAKGGPR